MDMEVRVQEKHEGHMQELRDQQEEIGLEMKSKMLGMERDTKEATSALKQQQDEMRWRRIFPGDTSAHPFSQPTSPPRNPMSCLEEMHGGSLDR